MRLEEITLMIFTTLNAIRILAYVPQIRKAAADQNGASSIAYSTWVLFFLANLATVAYAIINKGDMSLAICFAGNAACCLAIILAALSSRKRGRPSSLGGTTPRPAAPAPTSYPATG
jgi:hypothetical protein